MKLKVTYTCIAIILICCLYTSCKVDSKVEPQVSDSDIKLSWPDYFPPPFYNFEENPRTKEGFFLGRKLFYDPLLSKDGTISCGSCHQQFVAFAHSNHKISHGVNNKLGTRNSQALFNLMWNKEYFWDGGVKHLEMQPVSPIINPVEMAETMENVINKLNQNSEYRSLFKSAFNIDTINSKYLLKAITQFMGSFISAQSKYDLYLQNPKSNPLTISELSGLEIFKKKCNSCHTEPLFTDNSYRNNGLDNIFQDSGRYRITNINTDMGKFRVPTLRNIALTAPYMHDGRFETLPEVLNHYSHGIKQSATLDPELEHGITLSDKEKEEIIAFLNTLTDYNFTNDKRFKE
ncbi:MAG: c-type cytochrome [Bacteroidia bacterium]|nr:c-type cytochrome [Bacteroidia bacterium]